MRRIPGLELKFTPSTISDTHVQLFDLSIPLTGPNCPHASVRNRTDGHVTGDLFEEVKPGYYLFRMSGRKRVPTVRLNLLQVEETTTGSRPGTRASAIPSMLIACLWSSVTHGGAGLSRITFSFHAPTSCATA